MNNIEHRYAINEDERKQILNDINIGIWRAEFIPNQLPHMYGDENMYGILGAPSQMTPEQLYQYWYERIEPAYLSYVDQAVERLITTGEPVEVEYVWNHPECGKTIVRCDATLAALQQDDKTVVLGMHRNITDRIESSTNQDKEYQIVDYYKMSLCRKYLIRAYEEILSVDFKTETITPIAYRNFDCLADEAGSPILELIEKRVFLEDQEKVCNLFFRETARCTVSREGAISVDFRRREKNGRYKWVSGTLYLAQINGEDEYLFVIQDIRNEYKLKRLRQEKEDLLYSLMQEKSSIYEYDTQSKQLQILKYEDGYVDKFIDFQGRALSELVEKLCIYYVNHTESSNVRTFLSYENICNCVEKKQKKFISFPLDAERFQYDYIKISILPSSRLKKKAYLIIELMAMKEGLQSVVEAYIRNMAGRFHYIDLKELMMEKVQRESITDTLTRLCNRLGSERRIKGTLAKADPDQNAALIMLDLDNFKEVNDRFGHPMGDQVLYDMAQKLKACFGTEDILGRMGGDEYIVLVQRMEDRGDIHVMLQRVLQEMTIDCENETERITVTVSAGATFYTGQSYEELYREADVALYHAKKRKNKYSLFDDVK